MLFQARNNKIQNFSLLILSHQSDYNALIFFFLLSFANSCSEASEREAEKVSEQLQSVGISTGRGNDTLPSGKVFFSFFLFLLIIMFIGANYMVSYVIEN